MTASSGTASLGNKVFIDTDGDGIQDTGEAGLGGVTVKLLNSWGQVLATTTTNGQGTYSFAGLAAGTYKVQFVTPNGYQASPANQGGNDTLDSDAQGGITGTYTLTAGQANHSVDAGFIQNRPAIDIEKTTTGPTNANPVAPTYDNEDTAGGAGVPILTPGSSVTWTYRVANTGNTTFAAGDIKIVDDHGTPWNPADDMSIANGRIVFDSVAVGDSDNLFEAGEVWLYKATDTVQDLTAQGATSTFNFNGNTATDGADGNIRTYSAGDVAVKVSAFSRDKASGAWSSSWLGAFQGGLGVTDSSEGNGAGATHTIDNLGRNNYVLFEFNQKVVVDSAFLGYVVDDSDMTVWIGSTTDPFNNHLVLSDAVLTSLGFTEVNITDLYTTRLADINAGRLAGNVLVVAALATDTSPEDQFKIEKLTVQQVAPSGVYANTVMVAAPGAPGDTDMSHYTNPVAKIGDRVFLDADADGVQDAGEAGIAGVTVKLIDSAGGTVATTTTDGNGHYSFSGMPAGTYKVQFVTPSGFVASPANQGSDDTVDSDAQGGITGSYTLAVGQHIATVDAGFYQTASIGDRAFIDADADGVQDGGEAGLAGVTVKLIDSAGGTVATTTTGGNGQYSFTGLTPGAYKVQFVTPAGYQASAADQGGDDTLDSDATGGITGTYTLASGQADTTADAGFVPLTASLGDRVFRDTDGDGVQDGGEAGIAGVTVRLLDNSGATVATTTTDGAGNYVFGGLAPGSYKVQFVTPDGLVASPADQGGNDALDSDASGGITGSYTLGVGQAITTADAGFYDPARVPGSVAGRVWLDRDGDGIEEAGEASQPGVTVALLNADGTPTGRTTTTAADGTYLFDGVDPGGYRVRFEVPAGFKLTQRDQGGDDATDSDPSRSTGISTTITVPAGTAVRDVDAGVYRPAMLGDRVWHDVNGNGVQDSGEKGIADVTVKLLDAGGNVIATDITDGSGYYKFYELAPGTYGVKVETPGGYTVSTRDAGTNDLRDSDADATGLVAPVVVLSGESRNDVDAGLYRAGSIGDRVWHDTNANGVQDGGEAGAAGVTVRLLDAAGAVIATTVTGATGVYRFADLRPGTYAVQFVAPDGALFTARDAGGDDRLDSDAATDTGITQQVTLASGGSTKGLDAGLVPATPTPITGTAGHDSLHGTAGNDVLDAQAGNDSLSGGWGNDTLLGGEGHDTLSGGLGGDVLDGGAGVDVANYASAPGGVVASLAAPWGNTGWAAGDSYIDVENLIGSAFADQLSGDEGANRLDGVAGNDTLSGGGGNDTLVGGAGADVLSGGLGADRFVFGALAHSAAPAADTILDFARAEGDRIDLSAIDANATLAGNQAFAFVGSGAFLGGGAGSVGFALDGLDTLLLVDAGDGGAAEMTIRLAGLHTPLASDLVL